MTDNENAIHAVPTNIITGFLGVGKTSAILNLLKAKPSNERWAVLVNEFGEIGVDGSLFSGTHSEDQGVFIKEVPGGCMCCAAGLPMQIALNQLLAQAKPDRLLIEPTGLGHPLEVLEILSSEVYKGVLSLNKTVTLVDARKLRDERYTQHKTFNQQIAIADVIVGNKLDLYGEDEKTLLLEYVRQLGCEKVQVEFAEFGRIDPGLLKGDASFERNRSHHHHHHHAADKTLVSDQALPDEGYLKAENEGEGYQSMGWRFSADKIFSRAKLFSLLSGLKAERMKAVFITEEGIFGYNLTEDALSEFELDDCLESRIEMIYQTRDESIEARLMQCIL